MHYATATHCEAVQVVAEGSVRVSIGPGDVTGVLHVQGFGDAKRGIGRDRGLLRLSFAIVDEAGVHRLYLAILSLWALWPGKFSGILVRPAEGRFRKHVTLRSVLDTRDDPVFRYEDGRELVTAHKYNDVTLQLREEDRGLAARLTVYVGDLTQGTEDSYRSVDYEIPLERLLWRRAPRCTSDDVEPEAADYVDIRPLDTPPMQGETPSPIRVTHA